MKKRRRKAGVVCDILKPQENTMTQQYSGGHVIARDYDSVFIPATIFRCTDMVVATTKKMADYDTNGKWIEYTVGYNNAGEMVYTISAEPVSAAPDWIPTEILNLLE